MARRSKSPREIADDVSLSLDENKLEDKPLDFIPTGCILLDCVLGGGWPLGRIVNIVGDRSTGKTAIFIEASANFKRKFSDGILYYLEAEASFDREFAGTLGMPSETKYVDNVNTVEKLYIKILDTIEKYKDSNVPILFGVDSLDALSDEAELEREINDPSYGSAKAKKMSEIFRRLTKQIEQTKICLFIISQTRDKIGVAFGEKHTRSGGHALDFYASQILWLSELDKIYKTIKGIKRPIGINIKAYCKKNKVSMPFRSCEFPYVFGYGIDDVGTSLDFLNLAKVTIDGTEEEFSALPEAKLKLDRKVIETWKELEKQFSPKQRKYV